MALELGTPSALSQHRGMTMPKWATRLLTLLYLVLGYIMHHANLVDPAKMVNLWLFKISVLGLMSDALVALAAIGINGPQLFPKMASILGNPPGPSSPPAP
jgi:hypothetical protein